MCYNLLAVLCCFRKWIWPIRIQNSAALWRKHILYSRAVTWHSSWPVPLISWLKKTSRYFRGVLYVHLFMFQVIFWLLCPSGVATKGVFPFMLRENTGIVYGQQLETRGTCRGDNVRTLECGTAAALACYVIQKQKQEAARRSRRRRRMEKELSISNRNQLSTTGPWGLFWTLVVFVVRELLSFLRSTSGASRDVRCTRQALKIKNLCSLITHKVTLSSHPE